MYNYEIDDAIESVMDDMDEYNYGYDDTDEFCDALESMVYDMADYLCYEKGYSEDEALEAANVHYGCALETSSQIKQVRNQARKTYNKAKTAYKRGDTSTARELYTKAHKLDKVVADKKGEVNRATRRVQQSYINSDSGKTRAQQKEYYRDYDRGDRAGYSAARRSWVNR